MNCELYSGYRIITMNEDEMAKFYSDFHESGIVKDLHENEYLAIKDAEGMLVDKLCYQGGWLRSLKWNPVNSNYYGVLKPKNLQQEFAFDML